MTTDPAKRQAIAAADQAVRAGRERKRHRSASAEGLCATRSEHPTRTQGRDDKEGPAAAPREHPFRLPDRRVTKGLAALATATALALAIPTTNTAQAQPDSTTTAPYLLLDQQTPWVTPGGQFALRIAIPGNLEGNEQIDATVFSATASRDDFNKEVDGQDLGDRIADTGNLSITTHVQHYAPGAGRANGGGDIGAGLVGIRFATDGEPGLGLVPAAIDSPGVYPVEVRLRSGDGTVLDRLVTHLVRLPAEATEAPDLNFSVVMPIDAGAGIRPNGVDRADPVGNERLDTLVEALNDHPDVPLVVVPTPDTVATLAGGTRIGPLRRAVEGRQVLSSSYVPVDVAGWVASGLNDDLALQTTAGDAALADHLVDRPDRRTAIATETLTPEALAALRDLGADQVVIPETALTPLDGGVFPVTLGQTFEVQDSSGENQRAVAADSGLSRHIDQTGDPVLDASTLLADLAVIYFDRPTITRGVVLTLPRLWSPDPVFLATLLDALDTSSVIAPATIDQLFARVPEATATGESDPDGPPLVRGLAPVAFPSLGGYPDSLHLTRLTTQGFISFAGRQNPLIGSLQRRLLVSGSADLNRSQRRAYLDGVSANVNSATASVKAPDRQTVTLTSRDGRIPLNISNENLYDVTVLLEFNSEKLEFPDDDTVLVDLPRSSVTPVPINVSARSSGTFPLTVTITSPDQVLQVGRTRFTVRSTAISHVGLILSIGAGLFLALWWASHFRRVRRARKLVAADGAPQALA